MKKFILTAAAVFALSFTNAQDKKEKSGEGFSNGDVFLSGSVGFGSSKTGDAKENSFNFSPKVGIFVTENIAIGVELGLTTGKTDNGGNGTSTTFTEVKSNGFNGGVFGRYYFVPGAKFAPFANLGFGFGSTKNTTNSRLGSLSTSSETKDKTMNIGLGLGFNYFLTSNWALEASWAGLNYNTNDNGGNGADKTNSFGLNANTSSINFGMLYKF